MAIRRTHDLEIDQDLAFARRSWGVQRVGWLGMGLLLVLALAGIFGSGPLSHGEVSLPGLLRVEYQRFARYQAPQTLRAHVDPAATGTGEVRLWIDRGYLADTRVDTISPPPARVEAGGERLIYVFPTSRPGEPVTIVFALQAEHIGPTSGRVGLDGGETFAPFRQFVYP